MGWKNHRGSTGSQNATSGTTWRTSPAAGQWGVEWAFLILGQIMNSLKQWLFCYLWLYRSEQSMLLQAGSAFINLTRVFLWQPSLPSEGHHAASQHPNKVLWEPLLNTTNHPDGTPHPYPPGLVIFQWCSNGAQSSMEGPDLSGAEIICAWVCMCVCEGVWAWTFVWNVKVSSVGWLI